MPLLEFSLGVIPERLRTAVEGSGYSAAEVARRAGVSVQSMQGWLSGTKSPSAANLGALALITGRSVGYFYGEDDPGENILRDAAIGRRVRELLGVMHPLCVSARPVAA